MKEFKKGQTCFAAREDGGVAVIICKGGAIDNTLGPEGIRFPTAKEAKARAEELLRARDLRNAASKGLKYGHNYYAVRPSMSEPNTYTSVGRVWYGDPIDVRRLRQGRAFRTRGEAEERAEELNRTDKRYPKKMLVWDSDSDPHGKLERTVLGTLRGMYMTVENFGETLRAAGNAQAITVSFYRNAEDIPETLEDYLSEIDLPEGAAEKIVELAKKIKL